MGMVGHSSQAVGLCPRTRRPRRMRTVSFNDRYLATVPILIGAGMLGFWVAAIVTHRVPEIESGGIEIRFYIVAETVTALVLIAGGLAALIDPFDGWAIVLSAVGLGMLMYTLIVSPGYTPSAGNGPWCGCSR